MTGDLDIFPPDPEVVDLGGGRSVTLAPLPLRAIKRYVPSAAAIMPFVATGQWVQGMAEDEESFLTVAEVGSGLPRADIEAMNGAQIVRLIGRILVVNADFFQRHLVPEVQSVSRMLTALAEVPGGPEQSPGSSSAGTDTATSST